MYSCEDHNQMLHLAWELNIQLRPLKPLVIPKTQLDGGLDYDQPTLLLVRFMAFEQQCFDLTFLLTGGQFLISPSRSQVQ
ncbi:hypothetical protein ccbrp13_09670 [Ktedonobacteria bacterium brp13]|nr:hypothetical protein ccbrp13_09670 [Ktedonobacteria bacterium brp13]